MTPIELPQGTLELLILRTLQVEPQHGWAISERINAVTGGELQVQQGSLYPALHRMERRGLIEARWRVSENGRRAKYYELSEDGRQRLAAESRKWERLTAAVGLVLAPEPKP